MPTDEAAIERFPADELAIERLPTDDAAADRLAAGDVMADRSDVGVAAAATLRAAGEIGLSTDLDGGSARDAALAIGAADGVGGAADGVGGACLAAALALELERGGDSDLLCNSPAIWWPIAAVTSASVWAADQRRCSSERLVRHARSPQVRRRRARNALTLGAADVGQLRLRSLKRRRLTRARPCGGCHGAAVPLVVTDRVALASMHACVSASLAMLETSATLWVKASVRTIPNSSEYTHGP